jgi:hypothetical protein
VYLSRALDDGEVVRFTIILQAAHCGSVRKGEVTVSERACPSVECAAFRQICQPISFANLEAPTSP